MAKQPHRDDEQPTGPKSGAPKPPPAKPAIPNMSLDDPADAPPMLQAAPDSEVFEAEELEVVEFEDEAPVAHPAPAETTSHHDIALPEPPPGEDSEVFEAVVVSDDEVLAEEVVEEIEEVEVEEVSKPESDVFLADDEEALPLARSEGSADDAAESASEVMFVDEEEALVEDMAPAHPMDSPVPQAQAPISGAVARSAPASGAKMSELLTEVHSAAVRPPGPATEAFEDAPMETASGVHVDDGVLVDEVADEMAEAAPASDLAAEALLDDAETSASDIVVSEAIPAAPTSDLAAQALLDEPSAVEPAAPVSDLAAEVLFAEASDEPAAAGAPDSGVVFDDDATVAAAVELLAEAEEEVAEAAPASAVAAADEIESADDVLEAVEAEVFAEEPIEAVDEEEEVLEEVVADEEIEEIVAEEEIEEIVAEEEIEEVVAEEEIEEVVAEEEIEEVVAEEEIEEVVAEEEIEEAVAEEGVEDAEEELTEEDVFGSAEDDLAEAVPASEVVAAEEVLDEDITEAAPASAVAEHLLMADEDAEEVAEAAPASEVVAAEEVLDEDITEAAPASAVAEHLLMADEDAEEVAEAAPASAVAEDLLMADEDAEEVADEDAEEVAEAAPASAVAEDLLMAEEEEAAEEVLDEEIAEAAPASEVAEDLLVDEAEPAEVSSATRKSESVFDEELMPPAAASSGHVSAAAESDVKLETGATEFIDVPLGKKSGSSAAKKKGEPDSGTVFYDEGMAATAPPPTGGATIDFDRTVAFDALGSSGVKKAGDPDSLVTEEELASSSEGSAVNLGDLPGRKGSSAAASGIDPVAEALESGVEADDPHHPSVEFDELLDDSSEQEIKPARGKKGKKKDEDPSTELDADPLPASKGKKKDAKKGKQEAIAQTGDDVDLDAMFAADEPEAAEAIDEDAEAIEDDDAVEDDEAVEAAEADEADDVSFDDEVAEADDADEVAEADDADDVSFDDEVAEAADAEEGEAAEAVDDDAVSFDDDMAEAAEATDDDEAALDDDDAAEAAEADEDDATSFDDEEVGAAEALDDDDMDLLEDDEKPAKKTAFGKKATKAGTKTAMDDEDDDMPEDADDEEDDTSARKKSKKGKGKSEKAQVVPQRGRALPMMAGMFVGCLLMAAGLGGALYFAPDEVRQAADMVKEGTPKKAPAPVVKGKDLTKAQQARLLMDDAKFAEALKALEGDLAEPADLSTRGEAHWLGYFKDQTEKKLPLDRKDPPVENALKDLEKAKNNVLVAQINTTLDQADELAKMSGNEAKIKKDLGDLKTERDAADKFIDSIGKVLADAGLLKKDPDDKEPKAKFDAALVKKVVDDYDDKKTKLAMTEKTLKETEDAKKEADDKVAAVDKVLEGEKTKDKGDKGVMEIITARNTLKKDRDGLDATLKAAFKELVEGKIVPEGDAAKDIVNGAKVARQKAESPLSIPLAQLGMSLGGVGAGSSKIVEDAFKQIELLAKLSYYKSLAELGDTPDQKMDTNIILLQDRKKTDKVELDLIKNQTDWLLGNSKHLETRGKARYVQGLVDRNRENFKDARAAFEESLKMVRPLEKTGAWTKLAEQSKRELLDPQAYYLPRMNQFLDEGNAKAALDEANIAVKALPEEGRMFAQRGLIQFELIRGKAPALPEDALKAIRADADLAVVKNEKLAAEASYIKGLLEEAQGRLSAAEKLYREALDLHKVGKGLPEDAAKHRLALGRLLLRDRTEAAPVAAPPPVNDDDKKKAEKAAEKVGRAIPLHPQPLSPKGRGESMMIHPWTALVLSVTVGQAVEKTAKEKEDEARFEEAKKFATELIEAGKAAKDKKAEAQGYILLGHAYTKLGQRTQGLREFAKGMELLLPANVKIDEPTLSTLIDEHPAFSQPDLSHIQNDVIAHRHFGEGLHLYWARKYGEAEVQFFQAVKWYNQDARYQYFLGLAQLGQKSLAKRDAAYVSFEQSARIEAKQPMRVGEINKSLERIQGELRQVLNSHRYKGIAAVTEK